MELKEAADLLETVKEYEKFITGMDDMTEISVDSETTEDIKLFAPVLSEGIYGLLTDNTYLLLGLFADKGASVNAAKLKKTFNFWYKEAEVDLRTIDGHFVLLDRDFERLMLAVERCSEDILFKRLLSKLMSFAETTPSNYSRLISVYSDFEHLWGGFDPEKGNYEHFRSGVRTVKQNASEIRWLYENVEDYRSKKVIYGLIRFWLELDFGYKNSIVEGNYDDYFDLDVFGDVMSENEIFVDCGAYTGDTAESYFKNFKGCRRMYLYDMVADNLEMAKEKLGTNGNIVYRNVGVGSPEQAGERITVKNASTSTFSLESKRDPEVADIEADESEIELVTLDEDITEPVSFVKMDIEGAEIDALNGAKDHISKDHPKLAICTYHHYEHLWKIPRLIRSIDPNYKLYLRYNGALNGVMASEHVLLAI